MPENGHSIIPPYFFTKPLIITLVGCGGTGSQMLTNLARLNYAMLQLGHPGFHVNAYDPSLVSQSNIGRQLFASSDIGIHKSSVLIHRINNWYNFGWDAIPEEFTGGESSGDIIIGCVDNVSSRQKIAKSTSKNLQCKFWIDCGNETYTGQVSIGHGLKVPDRTLPNVLEMFPHLTSEKFKSAEDIQPSCSVEESLNKQSLFINQTMANIASNALWKMFRHGKIDHFAWFVDLNSGSTNAIANTPENLKRFPIQNHVA